MVRYDTIRERLIDLQLARETAGTAERIEKLDKKIAYYEAMLIESGEKIHR